MTDRKEFSRKIRQAAFKRAGGKCEKCSARLKANEGEVDHILPASLGGGSVLVNAQVLCRICHSEKTTKDIRRVREADRARDKSTGAIRPSSALSSRSKRAPKRLKKQMPARVFDVFGRPFKEADSRDGVN